MPSYEDMYSVNNQTPGTPFNPGALGMALGGLPPPPAPSAAGVGPKPPAKTTPAPPAGGVIGPGTKPKKVAGPLTGNRLVADTLERILRGESSSFGPDVVNRETDRALQARDSSRASGLDSVNRQLASRGLGRSPVGAGLAADVVRGSASDFSNRIGEMYSNKAKQDFADKTGAIDPYNSYLGRRAQEDLAAQGLAEQKRQFDISQANRGGGGGAGGPSDDDMLLQLLMGNEDF